MKAFVDDPDDLTPQWLSQALQTEVRSVAAQRVGTGQTGATYRLHLDADGCPPTLIAKLSAGDEAARTRVRVGYRREVGFYRDLAGTVKVRTAGCRYAAISDDALSFTLLLDDLAPLVPGVQAQGCSLAQAEDAVRNLAGLHAPRWCDPALFELPYLPRPTEEDAKFLGEIMSAATAQFVDRYSDDLDPADIDTLRAAAAVGARWQMTRPETFTVLHGDYRLDNLLFPPDGGPGVVAVDWQTLAVAPPGRDLAYFLGTSLRTEDRRAAERDLVRTYHEALVAAGVGDYSLDQCFEDYRLGQIQAPFVTTVGCIYATGERTRASDEMFLAMARRSCAAIRDLGSLDLL